MIGKFTLTGLEFYAYHGVYDSERLNGQTFKVDFSFETNIEASSQSDSLADTIDYTYICELIKEQMNIRSSLLEHVALRIVHSIKAKILGVQNIELTLTKVKPPIDAVIEGISLTVKA